MMRGQKKKAFQFIDSHRDEMLALWETLVNMDSGSASKDGVDIVARELQKLLDAEGMITRLVEFEKAGNTLIAELGMDRTHKGVAFLGHMDTVFVEGTAKARPFTIKDGVAYGPGAYDMKGGIVAIIYAIKALNTIEYEARPLKVILTGDEEIGHAYSSATQVLQEEVTGLAAAFNCEAGFADNGIIIGRKGVARFYLEVKGVAAHAGNAPENGRNAILELSHKVIEIEKLTNLEEGITLNVGTIEGGTVINAVPDFARAGIDLRFMDEMGAAKALKQLEKIAMKTHVQGTSSKLTGGITYVPMKTTSGVKELFELVKRTAREMGLDAPHPVFSNGGSDSAYTVMAGVPTVCGIGVKGGLHHGPQEYAIVDSLFERTKLLVASVLNLT